LQAMGFIFQPSRHQLLGQVKKHAHFITGRTLDVGCGPVSRYQKLFNSTEYVKLDIAPGPNVDVVGTAEAIPFPDSSFDSILCTEALNDVLEPTKAFAEFNRVLKPGGIIMISVPCMARVHESPTDYWRYTRNSLRKLASEANFKVEVIEERGGFWSLRAQITIGYFLVRFGVYGKWYERLFSLFAVVYGRALMWLDMFEKPAMRQAFTNGYLMVARK
jgi:SAM-dependent methyltransferase